TILAPVTPSTPSAPATAPAATLALTAAIFIYADFAALAFLDLDDLAFALRLGDFFLLHIDGRFVLSLSRCAHERGLAVDHRLCRLPIDKTFCGALDKVMARLHLG